MRQISKIRQQNEKVQRNLIRIPEGNNRINMKKNSI